MTEAGPLPEWIIAELIDQLGRSVHGYAFTRGLNPAQWAALRYYHRANRFSRTVGAFARYHATTQGTASQTTSALLQKGYLRRCPVTTDRRSFQLELSAKARQYLSQDPFEDLVTAARTLTTGQRLQLVGGLETMLGALRFNQNRGQFGTCGSCRHLWEGAADDSAASYACALFGERLTREEITGICANHQPAAGPKSPRP